MIATKATDGMIIKRDRRGFSRQLAAIRLEYPTAITHCLDDDSGWILFERNDAYIEWKKRV